MEASPSAITLADMASAQLWRAAVSVAIALQDATRLLAVPRFYSAFTIADPTCDALLSLGELAARVMRRATAASAVATADARILLQRQQQQQRVQEALVEEVRQAAVKTEARVLAPPDACCLVASHGSSLLLVACEQQPESLLVGPGAHLFLSPSLPHGHVAAVVRGAQVSSSHSVFCPSLDALLRSIATHSITTRPTLHSPLRPRVPCSLASPFL